MLIFTGLGLLGRELVNIRSSDIVVVIGGRSGIFGEFAIAYEEGKPIGVLTGTGGITDALRSVEASLAKLRVPVLAGSRSRRARTGRQSRLVRGLKKANRMKIAELMTTRSHRP